MRLRLLNLFLYCALISGITAQPNPFELRHRLTFEERQEIAFSSRNPFELIRGPEAAVIRAYLPSAVQPGRVKRPEDRRYVRAPGVLFWLYMGLFIMLTFLISMGRSLLGQMIKGMFNDQLTFSMLRNRERTQASPYFLWYLFFFFNAGILLYLSVNWYTGSVFPGEHPIYLLYFTLGVAGVYAVKHLALWLFGEIFDMVKPVKQYSFTINLYNGMLGLLLFPLNIAISYTAGGPRDFFLYTVFSLLGLSYLLRIARGLWIGLPYLMRHPIHFFLYLCAIELAPVLILWKWLSSGAFQ
ncbi:MAG: DUF4271 domain-containing protein [Saprospiraceae bacterium]|nr:DUF4271 domain-containing protein [Saprospiraceae bacterium]